MCGFRCGLHKSQVVLRPPEDRGKHHERQAESFDRLEYALGTR
jgi:hypothetical protein